MQQLGQLMNPRDERGWMIPRPNTKRRRVYEMMVEGRTAAEIMHWVELKRPAYNSHRNFITSWEKANKSAYRVKHR